MAEGYGILTLQAKVFGGCSRRKANALVGCLIQNCKYPERVVEIPGSKTLFAVREYEKDRTVYVRYHRGRGSEPWIEWSLRPTMLGRGISNRAASALRSAKGREPDLNVDYQVRG